MQDSIEDYIKISKNATPDDPIKLSKDAKLTAQIKKECDTRAVKIVEFLIEGKLRPEVFLRCLPFITQTHYQDIAEERGLSKLCGYPICGKRIPEMPKKQYYISTKHNKIYDITDRKNYCCNFCYKASIHIKKQIDNSPLWLRKYDKVPEYKLLNANDGGLPGECIDQGISKPVIDPFTSVSSFTTASLDEMVEREINPNKFKSHKTKSKMQTISESAIPEDEETENCQVSKPLPRPVKLESPKQPEIKKLPVIEEQEDKENAKANEKRGIALEDLLKRSVTGWLSLETYIFLFGEKKIKDLLDEAKMISYFENLKIEKLQQEQQIKYMEICRRLHLQEMAEEQFDSKVTEKKFKPLPDYKKLKEDSKDMDLKVKSFYSGVLYEKEDSNFKANDSPKEQEVILPLVEANSQDALRKKIFLNSINKSMQSTLQHLRIVNYSEVLSDVQNLVKTFKLRADNIVFKPFIWNYFSVILLYILALKDERIKSVLDEKRSQEYINLTFSILPRKTDFVKELVRYVEDMDNFIQNYILSM